MITAPQLTNTLNGFAKTMLEGVLRGLDPSQVDERLHAGAMSMREHIVHLTEGYKAVFEEGEHEWGTYQSPTADWHEQLALWRQARLDAAALPMEGSDSALYKVMDNLAAHELYHIGQMVVTRRWLEPNWNPDDIYVGA